MKIHDVFHILQEKKEAIKIAEALDIQYKNALKEYLKEYFGENIPNVLPLNKNQFISIKGANSFILNKGEKGNVYWIAKGSLITVKDGSITYGYAIKEIYQGEFESLPQNIRQNTLENACSMSKPVFSIAPQNHGGTSHANYGYILAENATLGLWLVWRKGATAYINRMAGNKTVEASLQIIHDKKLPNKDRLTALNNLIENNNFDEETKDLVNKMKHNQYFDIEIGGKLNKNLINKYEVLINDLFGVDANQEINNKIIQQQKKLKGVNNQTIISEIEEIKKHNRKFKI